MTSKKTANLSNRPSNPKPTMSTEDIICDEANGNGKLMKQLNNYIIVDVGANLTNKKFSRDLDAVIQRAKDSGTS